MTAQYMAALSGIVVSLLFSYFPGLSKWYGKLESNYKSLVMALMIAVVGGTSFGLGCWPAFPWPQFTCDMPGFWGFIASLVSALVANQATYLISPQKKAEG